MRDLVSCNQGCGSGRFDSRFLSGFQDVIQFAALPLNKLAAAYPEYATSTYQVSGPSIEVLRQPRKKCKAKPSMTL